LSWSRADADSDFDAVSTVSNTTTNTRADTIFTWWACRPPDTDTNSISTWWTCRRCEQSAEANANAKKEIAAH
jgi:hypothetical protein